LQGVFSLWEEFGEVPHQRGRIPADSSGASPYDLGVRPLGELISDEPAWPLVESWVAEAANDVRVLPTDRERGEETLHLLQVTTRSPLGAVALETGGLLVDHGWIRILGAGCETMRSSLASWNGLHATREIEPIDNALVIANDAVGGLFALNGGAFDGEPGSVFYFAPDTVDWLDTSMGYSGFLQWACTGDIARFYDELRWEGWERDVAQASADQGFALYPPPFTKKGKPVGHAHRRPVPIFELCAHYRDYARQIAELPEGAAFRIDFKD